MRRRVEVTELGDIISGALDEVERGETFALIRNGRVVAYLVPVGKPYWVSMADLSQTEIRRIRWQPRLVPGGRMV